MKKGDDMPNKITLKLERRSIVKSPFIKGGDYLKEYKNESLYDFKNFEFLKLGDEFHVIGSGGFGDVYLSKNKKNGKYYAIKQVDKSKLIENGGTRDILLREVNIHRRLIHDNIVRLYSYHEDNSNFYLIMDYVSKGTLYHKIKLNNGLDEITAFKYFIQVVTAVNFLHENNLIHRDLKPENILVDDYDNIKLCDFGWCVELKIGNRVTFCGTFEYMAPEQIKELPYNHAVDVWSLGVLLYELTHGYSPFKADDDALGDEYTQIFKNILKNNLTIAADISEECADLIKSKYYFNKY
jgi:serine/threonine protein kinase